MSRFIHKLCVIIMPLFQILLFLRRSSYGIENVVIKITEILISLVKTSVTLVQYTFHSGGHLGRDGRMQSLPMLARTMIFCSEIIEISNDF